MYSDLVFNNTPVHQAHYQKHLGVYLDMKLNCKLHIKEKISKAMKGIYIIRKLSNVLPRKSLIAIYKSFVRPHLTVIWSMINQIMKASVNKLKVFNIMLPLQSLVLLKEHPDLIYTMK